MKCLSLWQPWASLLVHGRKRVETRGWAMRHRGPLLVHAAKKGTSLTIRELANGKELLAAVRALGSDLDDLPRGAIVGRVDVVECYRTENVDFDRSGLDCIPDHPVWQYAHGKLRLWHEQEAFGDYSPGRFAWLCSNFIPFRKPIPFRGSQGLFEVPESILKEAA